MKRIMKAMAAMMLMVTVVCVVGCAKNPNENSDNEDATVTVPVVETSFVSEITETNAIGGGTVTSNGGTPVTECGVCWSVETNPTINDSHVASGSSMGAFSCQITNLVPNTTYYVRAYAINGEGIGYGNQISFITLSGSGGGPTSIPVVETSPVREITETSALGGGVVTADGGGVIIERGVCWSTQTNPIVSGDHTVFGTGAGTFSCEIVDLVPNTTYYVRAYAINGMGVGYGNEVNFTTLSGNGGGINAPEGAIGGVFSVSAMAKVYFSQGNLQYQASTNMWRFANHQWDYVGTQNPSGGQYYGGTVEGSDNANISATYDGWIDLFGWGTSGWNNGNVYYMPYDWQFTNDIGTGLGYGPTNGTNYELDLTGAYANADWGMYNAIVNGGNQSGLWHTLSKNEWNYLLEIRNASVVNGVANARFAKGKVVGVFGLILFPDSYSHPSTIALPIGINATNDIGWNNNSYSYSEWEEIENAGAVFLPAAGIRRRETQVENVNMSICYWSTTNYKVPYDHSLRAWMVSITENEYYYAVALSRACGCSVRLVCPAE